MALTPEQQAQLDALEAEKNKPEPRTDTGVAGVLHVLLDIGSGALAHLGSDAWAALHRTVESELGAPPEKDGGASSSGSSSSSKDKASKS